MPRYRKKPVEVDAIQWTGENGSEVASFLEAHGIDALPDGFPVVPRIAMLTAHYQVANAEPGDWIITEPMPGRFYPCKPDIFEATYEAVD